MPKVLFLALPTRFQTGKIKANNFPLMGIAYLISYLKERNIDSRTLDLSLDYGNKEKAVASCINEYKPDIIGLSLFSNIATEGVKIANFIKKNYSMPIVAGGPHISCTKEGFLKKSGVEYGVTKEGERPLYNLVKTLFLENGAEEERKKALYNIKGLIFKDSNGEYVINENDDLIEDIDSIPYPAFYSCEMDNYTDFRNKHLTIITSRGCPYLCSYCAAPLCTGRKFRMRSAKSVVDEMEHWKRYGFKSFGIFDDSFNQDIARAKDICRQILERKLDITFDLYNGMRANRVDEELFSLLKKAGCTFVGFGMESGNEEILKSIGKSLRKEDMVRAVSLANAVGMGSAVNFILGHPHETYETAMDTLNFARSLKCSYVNIYSLVPFPGTKAYETLKKTAKFFYDEDYYLTFFGGYSIEPIFETKELTRKQRIKLYKMGRNICKKRIFQFRFGKVWGSVVYVLLYNDKLFNLAHYIKENTEWLNRIYYKFRKGAK
ncbi:MAG: radical SAM protein [Candidatus Omnitrophota bacterium]